jgi:hypothetical protein
LFIHFFSDQIDSDEHKKCRTHGECGFLINKRHSFKKYSYDFSSLNVINVYFRLQNYESCNNYAQEINKKINEFKKLPDGSSERAKVIILFFYKFRLFRQ